MPTSIYDIKNPEEDKLIVIPGNKDKLPSDKELILTSLPFVDTIPYGVYAGTHCIYIRVSYSPLKKFPYDNEHSRYDWETNPTMTIGKLVEFCSNKIPNIVYIVGGEPMFKWDDEIKYLCEQLKLLGKLVFVETSGVIFPNLFENISMATDKITGDLMPTGEWVKTLSRMPSHVIIKPQIFDAVPDDETGGYFQHLYKTLRMWRDLEMFSINWHFDIDMDQEEEMIYLEIRKTIEFMKTLFEDINEDFNGERVVFVPKINRYRTRHIEDYKELHEVIGKFIINFKFGWVSVQPILSVLLN